MRAVPRARGRRPSRTSSLGGGARQQAQGRNAAYAERYRRLVREVGVAPTMRPIEGNPLRTTIDLDLQRFVDSLWRVRNPQRRGAVVALTPDGQVLASYSAPTYDPNRFISGISFSEWDALVETAAQLRERRKRLNPATAEK